MGKKVFIPVLSAVIAVVLYWAVLMPSHSMDLPVPRGTSMLMLEVERSQGINGKEQVCPVLVVSMLKWTPFVTALMVSLLSIHCKTCTVPKNLEILWECEFFPLILSPNNIKWNKIHFIYSYLDGVFYLTYISSLFGKKATFNTVDFHALEQWFPKSGLVTWDFMWVAWENFSIFVSFQH